MTTADQIHDEAKALPEALAREVLDFIEFLKQKHDRARDRDLIDAQAASLAGIWDNDVDEVWNDA